jgi:hypothetical protein
MKFVRSKGNETAAPAPAAPKPSRRKAPKPKVKTKARRGGKEDAKAGGKKQFVLMIGDEGAILVYMQGSTVVRRLFAVSPQPDHTGAMVELLAANPKVPLSVLADVIDQQYVRHTFPPVSSLSLNGLVKRRIDRDFQAEDIVGTMKLGREKTGRKEWLYLLIALAYTPLLQQWLDLLVEQPNELKGIYLVPVEAQHYIAALHDIHTEEKPLQWQLLVSHHKVSGFRQAVLRDGKLVFTRVTQAIDDAVPAVIAGNIEQEIMNTLEYLRRLGFLDNSSMEMMVVASQEVKEALDINRFKAGRAWVMTPLFVADELGLGQAALSADRFGDVVMAASFVRARKHTLKLATAYGQKLSQIYTARRGIKIVGAIAAVGLLGMAGVNMLKAMGDSSAAADTEAKRRPVQEELATVRSAIDGLNKDVAFKAAVMLTYDAYMKDQHAPGEFLAALAPFIDSENRVRTFHWGYAGTAAPAAAGGAAVATGSLPPPADPSVTGPLEMTAQFEFTGAFEDTSKLAAHVNDYIDTLKKAMPQYDIVHAPFPWEGKTETNVEITFNQTQQAQPQIAEGANKVTLVFRGPKANAAGAAPAPGAAPGPAGMVRPGMPGGRP